MKIWNVFRLELWKQKRSFFSTLLVLALGAGIPAVLLPVIRPLGNADSFLGAAAFLIFLLPLVIAFLGASGASALRKTEERMHEELLPVHPLIRVSGAYIASFLYSTCISLLVLSLLGFQDVFSLVSLRAGIFQIPVEVLFIYTCSLHCLSFAISYLLRLPMLGAGLALSLSGVDFFFRGVMYIANQGALLYHFGGHFPDISSLYLTFFLPLLLVVVCTAIGAKRIERGQRMGILRALALASVFLIGPLSTIRLVTAVTHVLDADLMGHQTFWTSFWDMFAGSLP